MRVEINKLPKSEVELKIEVPAQEWQEFFDGAAKELSKSLKIEGFRPGFVPPKLVEEKIGIAGILEEAAEHCVKKCYIKAILDNNIEAIGQPEVSILKLAKDNPFEFKAKVTIMPEVKLPDYKKIAGNIKRKKVSADEKDVEKAILWLQKSRAKLTLKSGPCEIGDWVDIKLKIKNRAPQQRSEGGKEDEALFDYENLKIAEPEIKDGFILGEGRLIPGLEEKIEGMSAGEEKIATLSFPENHYQRDLAGKQAAFEIKLESVKKMELPEISDQFAKDLGDFADLAGLKKNLREGINSEKENEETERMRQEILEKIAEKSEIEIPEILISSEQNRLLEDLKQSVSQRLGMNFTDYLAKTKKTEKELLDSFLPEVEKRVKNSLALREISKKERIEVPDEEAEAEANKILKTRPENQKLDYEKLKDYTKEVLRNEKTFAKLESFAMTNDKFPMSNKNPNTK